MRRAIRALLLTIPTLLVAGCATPSVVTHTEYRYSLAGPTGDFHPGQRLPLTWKASAEVVTGSPPLTSGRVCVALVGPYGSVEELKVEAHIDPEHLLEGMRRFAGDREKRLARLRTPI